MNRAPYFIILIQLFFAARASLLQRSPYSLQGAVDELHQRDVINYPLNVPPSQQYYFNGAFNTDSEQDYWNDDSVLSLNNIKILNRHKLNTILANYLKQETSNNGLDNFREEPFDDYEFDGNNKQIFSEPNEKKRLSFVRKRDSKYDFQPTSIFREREIQKSPSSVTASGRSELTKEFLHEIEEVQELERDDHFREALRSLLNQYQQQEDDVEDNEFEEKKHKRMPPFYMLMQKKRSYPVLPWLPYSERKKRFPVAKRSTKSLYSENMNLGKTEEKVAKELSELFGSSSSATTDKKKKRSIDEQTHTSSHDFTAKASTIENGTLLKGPSNNENKNVTNMDKSIDVLLNEHSLHHQSYDNGHNILHIQKEHKHRKRSNHHGSHESHDEEEASTESEEREEEEGEEEDEGEFEEEDLEKRKKKRDLNIVKNLLQNEKFSTQRINNSRQKKSIDWSTYFGIDRKKKAAKSPHEEEGGKEDQEKKDRHLNTKEIQYMDRKLQSIEDFIIDETIKYTGAHEGIVNPDEIRQLKDHVLSRLATAYSLEKMRRALKKMRKYVDADNHLLHNVIEPDNGSENLLEKRLSVKKEQATEQMIENNSLSSDNDITKEINKKTMMGNSRIYSTIEKADLKSDDSSDVTKRKKNVYDFVRYPELPSNFGDADEVAGVGVYETLNDAYLGNKNYIMGSNQCPLIESMSERCNSVEFLSVDTNQELLPICGVHQICYLCGTSQMACDYQYLADADTICGNNNDCKAAARSILMILRGTVTQQLGPKECMKNSCLRSAMREIGF